jgi:hypothetical protein
MARDGSVHPKMVIECIRPEFGIKGSTMEQSMKRHEDSVMSTFDMTILEGDISGSWINDVAMHGEELDNVGVVKECTNLVQEDVFTRGIRCMS